jgi:CO/xanthine dehydrogenase Mo-binding subunit
MTSTSGPGHAAFVRATQAHAVIRASIPPGPGPARGLRVSSPAPTPRPPAWARIPPAAVFPGRGRALVAAPIPPWRRPRAPRGRGRWPSPSRRARPGPSTPRPSGRRRPRSPARGRPRGRALAPGAPAIWPARPATGPSTGATATAAVAAAFLACATRGARACTTRSLAPAALEPARRHRPVEPGGGAYTLTASTQGVAVVRRLLAEGLKVSPDRLRVVTPDVGGGFGNEGAGLSGVRRAAVRGAPHRAPREVAGHSQWRVSRRHTAGRDACWRPSWPSTASGRFLACSAHAGRARGLRDRVRGGVRHQQHQNGLSSVYRIPAIAIDVTVAFTSAHTLGPTAGAGRPRRST